MTTRERQRRRRTRHNRSGHFALIAIGAVFGMIAVVVLAGVIVVAAIAQKVPPLNKLVAITQGQASSVYYSDGSQIGLIKSTILRQAIGGSQMPRYLREATVSIEDQRFYQHGAVDYLALARAALTDLTAGQTLQGGSTITMQLVRNLYLPDDRSFSFKVKEAVIAQRLEQAHSKSWILTAYLNTVPYGTDSQGQTAAGVQAASWTFFDQPASRDDLAQSALLAGLPQAPTEYNPFNYPRVALRRRNVVLAKMAQLGYISAAKAAAAEAHAAWAGKQQPLRQLPRQLLPGLRQGGAGREVRGGARGRRRPEGLHDDRPAPAGAGEGGDRWRAEPADRPLGGAGQREPGQRVCRCDGPVRQLRAIGVQPRDPGSPPARLDLQGDRARRRACRTASTLSPPTTSRTHWNPGG